MATPSTSKKIQRVQRAGVTRRAGQRRPIGYPATIVGIIVVGLVLVWFARDARINGDGDRPRSGIDTWYAAYETNNCGAPLPNLLPPAQEQDIEALGNGVILIGPTTEATAGDNATFSHFFENQGMTVTNDSVTLADGTELKAGDSCGEGDDATTDTVIKMFVWPPQATDKTEPRVVTEDFGSVRFEQSGQAFSLALVEADADTVTIPGAIDRISSPNTGAVDRSAAATTTTPAAEGDAAATTTTVAPAEGDAGTGDAEAGDAEGGDATTTTAADTTTTTEG